MPSEAWIFRRNELLNELLTEIGRVIDFEVDPVEVETGVYAPQAHVQIEQETNAIRQGLAKILSADALPMNVSGFPATDEEFRATFLRAIAGIDAWVARANEPAQSAAPKPADRER